MGSGKGITFTVFAVLGALAGYATYMANKDEFSDETIDNANVVINKIQNVGTDIKRTYTSIGDKQSFKEASSNLGKSSMKLMKETGNLLASGANDMYSFAKSQISHAVKTHKVNKPTIQKTVANKSKKVSNSKSKSTKKK